jgi:hypothetical protein
MSSLAASAATAPAARVAPSSHHRRACKPPQPQRAMTWKLTHNVGKTVRTSASVGATSGDASLTSPPVGAGIATSGHAKEEHGERTEEVAAGTAAVSSLAQSLASRPTSPAVVSRRQLALAAAAAVISTGAMGSGTPPALALVDDDNAQQVGPGIYCTPRHRMPSESSCLPGFEVRVDVASNICLS